MGNATIFVINSITDTIARYLMDMGKETHLCAHYVKDKHTTDFISIIVTLKRLGLTMDKLIKCWFGMLVKEHWSYVKEETARGDNTAITVKKFLKQDIVRSIARRYLHRLFNIIPFAGYE